MSLLTKRSRFVLSDCSHDCPTTSLRVVSIAMLSA